MKNNKRKVWPIILTIFIAVIGIVLLLSGICTYVPPMGEPGWFDASSNQGFLIAFGIFLTIAGLSSTFIVGLPLLKGKFWNPQDVLNKLPYYLKGKNNERVCEYCKTINSDKDTKCKSCGAPLKSKDVNEN